MLTLQPQTVVTHHQNEMLLLGSFHAPNPAKSIRMQLQGCDTMSEGVVSLAVVWNQCPFSVGLTYFYYRLHSWLCATVCKQFVCVFITFVPVFGSVLVWIQQQMYAQSCKSVCLCLCMHLFYIMLTDSEDPLHTHTLSLALFSSQVRYMHHSTSFHHIHHINRGLTDQSEGPNGGDIYCIYSWNYCLDTGPKEAATVVEC